MLLDMKVQASEYPGVSLLVEDAADSSLLQVEQIRSLIKRKVDLLIISANEIFWISAAIFILLLGLVWFARPPFSAGGGGGGAH